MKGNFRILKNKLNKPFFVLFSTIILDAFGIGLIIPILPELLKSITPANNNVAIHFGILTAVYAFMQFLFSPLLGSLSDKFGRKPVLLVSLAGAAVDYIIMFKASTLAFLYLGRIIAGITGASVAVANAYIADISINNKRAEQYGIINAAFGLGFVGGPMLGGILGAIDLRFPFLLAAVLNGMNFIIAYLFLPESKKILKNNSTFKITINPISALKLIANIKGMNSLLYNYFIIQLVGQASTVLWSMFCADRFGWNPMTIGISLAGYGIIHAIFQASVTGVISRKFGMEMTVLIGILLDCCAYVLFAFTTSDLTASMVIIIFAAGSIGTPALQAILSNQIDQEKQGSLQGLMSSVNSLTSVIGPIMFSFIYSVTKEIWNGWGWIFGTMVYITCIHTLINMFSLRKDN